MPILRHRSAAAFLHSQDPKRPLTTKHRSASGGHLMPPLRRARRLSSEAILHTAGPSCSGKSDRDKFVLERRTRDPKRAGLWVIRQVPNNNMIIWANPPAMVVPGLALANIVPPVQMK